MARRFILQGDSTDHNGTVLDGIPGSALDGRPMAYIGGLVKCHTCQKDGVIVSDGSPHTVSVMGKQVALENDLCQCACEPLPRLIASQTRGALSL
ncbi:PAAR domain-containing protein [bacterium M00.F.Ca.ET.228.01.1.1]|uniref:PAAR domain-containing protein n=1 Tax=Paraburkholderia phenoliruptrix TaxID=252970 RepID=UPI001093149A|nr:PAAR domain-containing protein [Paraburkholderia phenoliruptrix]TGP40579.1 PAAR domain-containing protein [bacterium M00.F.Ca.ET.228.01.1.1]TGR96676.1 PAAR domain-containing protein [bacterium M00.F.Ca.ET.191.01.1.1]TGT97943.1 PAAR domain-containing protein [bacterium M00.F.Ca.ET.155.01.1.1]MBW0445998.1 PAAR domain-containing protein [Paraburkholderia phenoliruptrix]MBW9100000.1 PAAR domain-containing protein [Paraburkholderia phenoliruptrix]